MSYVYKNISGSTAELLLRRDALYDGITSLNIANSKASGDIKVDLYIIHHREEPTLTDVFKTRSVLGGDETVEDYGDETITYTISPSDYTEETVARPTYYIVKNKSITNGTNLLLQTIDYDITSYDLYLKLDASDSTADVILNIKNK